MNKFLLCDSVRILLVFNINDQSKAVNSVSRDNIIQYALFVTLRSSLPIASLWKHGTFKVQSAFHG